MILLSLCQITVAPRLKKEFLQSIYTCHDLVFSYGSPLTTFEHPRALLKREVVLRSQFLPKPLHLCPIPTIPNYQCTDHELNPPLTLQCATCTKTISLLTNYTSVPVERSISRQTPCPCVTRDDMINLKNLIEILRHPQVRHILIYTYQIWVNMKNKDGTWIRSSITTCRCPDLSLRCEVWHFQGRHFNGWISDNCLIIGTPLKRTQIRPELHRKTWVVYRRLIITKYSSGQYNKSADWEI
jgi:hypothetical protein